MGGKPKEDDWRPDLATLRACLDDIDDKIHNLLMDRARVVEQVARSGKAAAFRPGREAEILRRLLGRHEGGLPPRTLVRMWREMLAGTTAMQTPVRIALYDPTPDRVLTAIAREHFGALTPVDTRASADAALAEVGAGAATMAVLPFPGDGAAWWPALTAARPRLHIVARLPFWADRPPGVPDADALVVASTPPDVSARDRSFIAFAQSPDRARLAGAGLTALAIHGLVAEVDGLVRDGDPRLATIDGGKAAVALGGYAVPVAEEPA
jgi:chorismate mutase/prephenate dehydratase